MIRISVLALLVAFCGWLVSPAVAAEAKNLALEKTATASSVESDDYAAKNAVDGKADTRWSSSFNDDQWLQVDLGSPQKIEKITILWEPAYASEYKLQASDDGKEWKDLVWVKDGKGGEETHTFSPVTTRYVRMLGIKRGTEWGFSIFEFRVFAEK